jgi:hypothetical protein
LIALHLALEIPEGLLDPRLSVTRTEIDFVVALFSAKPGEDDGLDKHQYVHCPRPSLKDPAHRPRSVRRAGSPAAFGGAA